MGKPFLKNHQKTIIGREIWNEFQVEGKVYSLLGLRHPEIVVTELCDFEFPEDGIGDALKAVVLGWE